MNIVLLGSGHVATQLGRSFKMAGQDILQVWSRDKENAEELASSLASESITDISEMVLSADLYIIAVKDDAIKDIITSLTLQDQLIVHTSGSTGLDILDGVSTRTGVFYPLQTFSKKKAVDFRQIPIAIEGNTPEVTEIIRSIADRLSEKVIVLHSMQRRTLHVAAVFACNFTNHLYALAQEILKGQDLDFDLLRPLIAETALKIQTNDPTSVQTGPASRHDNNTIKTHLELLQSNPDLQELYSKLSQSIVNLNKQL